MYYNLGTIPAGETVDRIKAKWRETESFLKTVSLSVGSQSGVSAAIYEKIQKDADAIEGTAIELRKRSSLATANELAVLEARIDAFLRALRKVAMGQSYDYVEPSVDDILKPKPEPSKEKKNNWPLVLGLGGGVVLLALLLRK